MEQKDLHVVRRDLANAYGSVTCQYLPWTTSASHKTPPAEHHHHHLAAVESENHSGMSRSPHHSGRSDPDWSETGVVRNG